MFEDHPTNCDSLQQQKKVLALCTICRSNTSLPFTFHLLHCCSSLLLFFILSLFGFTNSQRINAVLWLFRLGQMYKCRIGVVIWLCSGWSVGRSANQPVIRYWIQCYGLFWHYLFFFIYFFIFCGEKFGKMVFEDRSKLRFSIVKYIKIEKNKNESLRKYYQTRFSRFYMGPRYPSKFSDK